MDVPHDEGRSGRLAAARLALYRPDADDATRARYEALLGEAGASDGASAASQDTEALGVASRVGRPRMTGTVVTVLLLLLLVGAGFSAVLVAREPPSRPALPTGLPLAAALDRERSVLPAAWRHARVGAASDDLDGATPLHAAGRVLLVVRCPPADRSFQAVAGTRTSYGACGRPAFVSVADGSRVVVTTRGVLPFSAALLTRNAGS